MSTRWMQGAHHAVVWAGGAALVSGQAPVDAVCDLWSSLEGVISVVDFVDHLAQALGLEQDALPPYAVAVRGGAASERTLAAGGFAVEEADDQEHVTLHASHESYDPDSDAWRPIAGGVVPAGTLIVRLPVRPRPAPLSDAPGSVWAGWGGLWFTAEEGSVEAAAIRASGEPGSRSSGADTLGGEAKLSTLVPSTDSFMAPGPPAPPPIQVLPPPPAPVSPPPPGNRPAAPAPPPPDLEPPSPHATGGDEARVLAAHCRGGHPNPPDRPQCRVCGRAVDGEPVEIPQPPLGRMVDSSGGSTALTGPVIVGRSPRAPRIRGSQDPELVTLAGPHISTNHLALRVDGWTLVARDLGSTNGSFLRRGDAEPVRLGAREVPVSQDDVIDLGHGVFLRFEEVP